MHRPAGWGLLLLTFSLLVLGKTQWVPHFLLARQIFIDSFGMTNNQTW